MSKLAERRAVRALPILAAELRCYKRRVVAAWRERALEAERAGKPRAVVAYTWERYRRERAKSPAEFRVSYQSEQVQRIARTPRALLFAQTPMRGRVVVLEVQP